MSMYKKVIGVFLFAALFAFMIPLAHAEIYYYNNKQVAFHLPAGFYLNSERSEGIITFYNGTNCLITVNAVPKKDFSSISAEERNKGRTVENHTYNGVAMLVAVDDPFRWFYFNTDTNTILVIADFSGAAQEKASLSFINGIHLVKNDEQDTTLVSNYVTRCYKLLLNRSPDEAGKQYWVKRLASVSIHGAEIVRQFINSPEFLNRGLSDETVLELLYKSMMDRTSDANGLAYWVELLNQGVSMNYIVNEFAYSQEFWKICSDYGITAGGIQLTEYRDKNLNITRFVGRCYQQALNRKPDVAGLNDWCGKLINRAITPKEMAAQFIFSNEAISQNWDDKTFLTRLYRLYMGREPDTGGLQYWLVNMYTGTDRNTVNNGFAESYEFSHICLLFGLS